MKKSEILLELILKETPNIEVILQTKNISLNKFVEVLSIESNYNFAKELKLSAQAAVNLTKKCFPNKKPNVKICYWLLFVYGYRFCPKCKEVYILESNFHKNKGGEEGYNSWCKVCEGLAALPNAANKSAKYLAAKLQRVPKWSDPIKIQEFYLNCPKDHQVDHIIPLRGETVSGLHVLSNLQYLSTKENNSKGNKFKPG